MLGSPLLARIEQSLPQPRHFLHQNPCELRQIKYLNNRIEQDHRFIKRLVKPGLSFCSVETAWRTLRRYEVMHLIRKGQVNAVGKGDSRGQARFIAILFGVAA